MPELKAAIVPVTPFQQNCTILWEEPSKRAVVIDPGGEVPRILEAIAQARRTGRAHPADPRPHRPRRRRRSAEGGARAGCSDGGAASRRTGGRSGPATMPIEGPDQRDRFLLQGLEAQAPTFGMSGVRNVLPDRWLAEGDEVRVGEQAFEVLHCPGHTPGHVVFVNQAARFAIVGDVLFAGSVGRTDFPYGDHAALIGAIKNKLLPLGDDSRSSAATGRARPLAPSAAPTRSCGAETRASRRSATSRAGGRGSLLQVSSAKARRPRVPRARPRCRDPSELEVLDRGERLLGAQALDECAAYPPAVQIELAVEHMDLEEPLAAAEGRAHPQARDRIVPDRLALPTPHAPHRCRPPATDPARPGRTFAVG